MTNRLKALAIRIAPIAAAHPGWVKFIADAAAVTAAVLGAAGALALVGAGLSFIGSYAPVVLRLVNPLKLVTLATKAWAAAQWLLNAAMDANPIGLTILAVAAIVATIAAIYHYRAAIEAGFGAAWKWLKKLGSEAYEWGANMLKKFAEGIESAAMWPVHAIEHVVNKMSKFVLGHSPIPQGPLHDLNLGRDLARTIQPAPVLSAIRRVAMVTALAAPMMVGAGASPALAAAGGAGEPGGAPINITVHYHVTAGSPEEFTRAARKHADELVRILKDRMAVRARTEFN